MYKNQKTKRIGVRLGVALVALVAVSAIATGGAAAADPADLNEFVRNATDKDLSGPLPADYNYRGGIILVNETMGGTLDKSEVTFDTNGVPINVKSPDSQQVRAYINETDIPDGGLDVEYSISGSSGTTTITNTIYKNVINPNSVTINKTASTDVQTITLDIDGSEVDPTDYQTIEAKKGAPDYGNYSIGLESETGSTPYGTFHIENQTTATVSKTLNRSEIPAYQENALNELFNSTVTPTNTTLYFPESVDMVKIDGEVVYEADAPLGGGGGGSGSQTLLYGLVVAGAAVILLARD